MSRPTRPDSPIELSAGTVHRVVVDLVRIGAWVEQQAGVTTDAIRRRQLHTAHLACRLTAEIVHDALFRPTVIRSGDDAAARSDFASP